MAGKGLPAKEDRRMDSEIIGRCWSCSAGLAASDYGRENSCLTCGKAIRVCRNCRWFAPGRPNDCEEPMAEEVVDRERANFCDFFEPSSEAGAGEQASSQEELLKAAEDLFKF
jgi:predicted RNA-binding Zn-ribbon protein involved in translation (DUF1610 family)